MNIDLVRIHTICCEIRDRIVATFGTHHENVVTCTSGQRVIAGATSEGDASDAAVQAVSTCTTLFLVVATATRQCVAAATAGLLVISGAARFVVAAGPTFNVVATGTTILGCVSSAACQCVRAGTANQRICASPAY